MAEFNHESGNAITEKVAHKRIKSVVVDDIGENAKLIFIFVDGSTLSLEYDWIYGWEFRELQTMAFDNSDAD